MKLATIRVDGATRAARLDGDQLVEVDAASVGDLLQQADWAEVAAAADGARHPATGADFATLVPRPTKTVCVGLNYKNHIQEMGRDLPEYREHIQGLPAMRAEAQKAVAPAR